MSTRIFARLRNWGEWLNYDAHIGPKDAVCVSIESRHIPEAGDVWDEDPEPPPIVPDVADAEAMNAIIQQLQCLEQYALSLRYGGMPAVFRPRRVSKHHLEHLADNAETLLAEMLKRCA